MTTIIGICSLIFAAFYAIFTWKIVLTKNINIPAFMAQIQRLVSANNGTRAIRLCQCAPKTRLAKAVSRLIVLSNNPHRLYLEHKKIEAEYAKETTQPWPIIFQLIGYGVFLLCLSTLILNANDKTEGPLLCAIAGCLIGFNLFFASKTAGLLALEQSRILRLMNLLFWLNAKQFGETDPAYPQTLLKAWTAEPATDEPEQAEPSEEFNDRPEEKEPDKKTPPLAPQEPEAPTILEKL